MVSCLGDDCSVKGTKDTSCAILEYDRPDIRSAMNVMIIGTGCNSNGVVDIVVDDTLATGSKGTDRDINEQRVNRQRLVTY
jgi:hypothetical protein